MVNYEVIEETVLYNDTLKPGFYSKILIDKSCFKKNENLYFDIYSYLLYNLNYNFPPYPHEFDDGTYSDIELYLKNGKVKRMSIKSLPNYVNNIIWTNEKLKRFRKLFKGINM